MNQVKTKLIIILITIIILILTIIILIRTLNQRKQMNHQLLIQSHLHFLQKLEEGLKSAQQAASSC
jgi:hypothetical protein